jgi:hypothetical protein
VPEKASDHYATMKFSRQQKGLSLDENDLWIAATAVAIGAILITRDSDFQQIDGLAVNDWTVSLGQENTDSTHKILTGLHSQVRSFLIAHQADPAP